MGQFISRRICCHSSESKKRQGFLLPWMSTSHVCNATSCVKELQHYINCVVINHFKMWTKDLLVILVDYFLCCQLWHSVGSSFDTITIQFNFTILYFVQYLVELYVTLWHPLLPYRYSYEASCARPDYAVMYLHTQPWVSKCPDVKNYKRRLNPVWYRMLYSCTHMATVAVKGLTGSHIFSSVLWLL